MIEVNIECVGKCSGGVYKTQYTHGYHMQYLTM